MKQASHLLSEPPMLIYPSLAKLLGINKATMLQQLHFLLNVTKTSRNTYNFIDGCWWVYNSYPQWQRDHFVWLSESAIKNLFNELEDSGLVLSRQGVKNPTDRRKWYTIDYEAWEVFCQTMRQNLSDGSDKNCPMNGQKLSDDSSETTTESSLPIEDTTGDISSFKDLDAPASTATSSALEESTPLPSPVLLPADDPIFDEQPPALYPCTPADVNALIGMWWEWTPIRPVRRGKVIDAKEHFANTANREYAENLIQRGVVPSDVATFLGEVRNDPDSCFYHLREKEMTFCYLGAVLEEWVAEDRAENWYTETAPRITPRKPGVPILMGEIAEGENLLERMKNHPDLIVDIPPRFISPHEAAAGDEEDSSFSVDDATALKDLAEMGIDL